MGRTKIQIDKSDLVRVIAEVEQANKFTNRSDLAQAVADKMPANISPAVVLLRISEFGIEPLTPKGKRGRPKGSKLTDTHKQAMMDGRKSKVVGNIEELRRTFPESKSGLIDKIEKGSLRSAVKAKCLECTQFITIEIKNCTCTGCPLHSFRPYQ